MRVCGEWISDINYSYEGTSVIPAGTRARVKDLDGDYYVYLRMAGKDRTLGNDYSRNLSTNQFLRRYIVTDDPRIKLATFDEATQNAIKSMRLTVGMTEEQVLMATGYPIHSYTPNLKLAI